MLLRCVTNFFYFRQLHCTPILQFNISNSRTINNFRYLILTAAGQQTSNIMKEIMLVKAVCHKIIIKHVYIYKLLLLQFNKNKLTSVLTFKQKLIGEVLVLAVSIINMLYATLSHCLNGAILPVFVSDLMLSIQSLKSSQSLESPPVRQLFR